jgi:hypothetical protein
MTDAETVARRMAAEKMGLVKDTHGLRLPDDLWRQMMPAAEAYLEELSRKEHHASIRITT